MFVIKMQRIVPLRMHAVLSVPRSCSGPPGSAAQQLSTWQAGVCVVSPLCVHPVSHPATGQQEVIRPRGDRVAPSSFLCCSTGGLDLHPRDVPLANPAVTLPLLAKRACWFQPALQSVDYGTQSSCVGLAVKRGATVQRGYTQRCLDADHLSFSLGLVVRYQSTYKSTTSNGIRRGANWSPAN